MAEVRKTYDAQPVDTGMPPEQDGASNQANNPLTSQSDLRSVSPAEDTSQDVDGTPKTTQPAVPEGPRPLQRTIPSGRDFPVASLGPLRSVVEDVHGITQAPAAIPAQSALAVAALTVQGHADVDTLGGRRPTSLFCLTIAASGERKSTCDDALLQTLYSHERAQDREYRAANDRWKDKKAVWDAKRAVVLGGAKKRGGKSSSETSAELGALGPEPTAPPKPDRIVTEPTLEGLVRLFAEGQPSLGLFSDEGGQFLGGHAMSADHRMKTLAGFNKLWQGDAIRRTRQGDGSYSLYDRRLSLHLMVQPVVADQFLADDMTQQTGFLPRFLISHPESTIGTRLSHSSKSPGRGLEDFTERLREILDTPMPTTEDGRELTPRCLSLDPEARQLLKEYADTVERAQAVGGHLRSVSAYASKSAEQAARIAGVMTLWRDLRAIEVTADTMKDAITLAEYYLDEALRISSAAGISADIRSAERLRVWLLENWPHDEIVTNEIVQRAPISSLRDTKAARPAIKILEDHGWLVPLPNGAVVRGSRRKSAWRIVRTGDAT